jgi:capping protein alpha
MSGDGEEASPATKLNIANYFIMSSPTGEVHDVLLDVAKLVNDPGVLSDAAIRKIMREYNHEQLQPAKTPAGHMLIASQYGFQGDDKYVDPSTGKIYKFDQRKHVFSDDSDGKSSLNAEVNSYRTAIEKAMVDYLAGQYKQDKCVVTVYGADDGTITVCLSARNVHLAAFWSGGWRSIFSFNCKTKGQCDSKCNTKVSVHYFEDGNVQLHAAIEKNVKIAVADPESTASGLVKAISRMETDYQASLEEMYVQMHDTTFKAMRRFLPITKQPMTWNVNAHAVKVGQS